MSTILSKAKASSGAISRPHEHKGHFRLDVFFPRLVPCGHSPSGLSHIGFLLSAFLHVEQRTNHERIHDLFSNCTRDTTRSISIYVSRHTCQVRISVSQQFVAGLSIVSLMNRILSSISIHIAL